MINKVQKYLLENHPLLWNIRLLPISIIILVANLSFFGIGYAFTDTTFNSRNYYSIYDNMGVVYFASIVIAIIIFVAWLIFYFRNNALKVFYPRKNSHVLIEWTLCFLICIGLTFIPLSLSYGSISKWKANTSLKEASNALRTIYKSQILIPSNIYNYIYDTQGNDNPIHVPDEFIKDIELDSVNLAKYSFEYRKNGIKINGYIGSSLLFFKNDHYYYYPLEDLKEYLSRDIIKRETLEVKNWLQAGDSIQIKSLMNEYMHLIKKHNLQSDINVDQWFNRIYHPPYFSVDTSSVIMNSIGNSFINIGQKSYSIHSRYKDSGNSIYVPEIDDYSLRNGYESIINNHRYNENFKFLTLTCLSIALTLSFFVFSCRITGGKKWLKSLLFLGIFTLCLSLFTAMVAWSSYENKWFASVSFTSSWIILFIFCLGYLITKIANQKEKHTSNVVMTIFIWYIPYIIPIIYALLAIFFEHQSNYDFTDYFHVETMFWINIPICVIAMYPISLLIRSWKSLAEE